MGDGIPPGGVNSHKTLNSRLELVRGTEDNSSSCRLFAMQKANNIRLYIFCDILLA